MLQIDLDTTTLAMRRKRGNTSTRMLQVTGQLASSLQSSHDHQSATLSDHAHKMIQAVVTDYLQRHTQG